MRCRKRLLAVGYIVRSRSRQVRSKSPTSPLPALKSAIKIWSMPASNGEAGFERFEIETVSVDGMLAQFDNRIDFVKIDVEGAEPLVLRGAVETIRLNPQLQVMMEWSPSQIRDAGFDVDEFIREINSLQLCAGIVRPFGVEKISLSALLNIGYAAGIVLSK
jgi:Methyltransferase FkbM domain